MSLPDTRESIEAEAPYLLFDYLMDQAQDHQTWTEAEAITKYKEIMKLGMAVLWVTGASEAPQTGQ